MGETYFIFTSNGWWGAGGTFVSEFKDAKSFTHEEAVAFCKRRFNAALGVSAVPVSENDVQQVMMK